MTSKNFKRNVNIVLAIVLIVGVLLLYIGVSGTAGKVAGQNMIKLDVFNGSNGYSANYGPTSLTLTVGQSGTFTVSSVSGGSYNSLDYSFTVYEGGTLVATQTGGSSTLIWQFNSAGSYSVSVTVEVLNNNQVVDNIYCSSSVQVDYTVTVSTTGGGSGSVSDLGTNDVPAGGSLSISFSASANNLIGVCSIDGAEAYNWYGLSSGSYTFSDVQSDQSISIWFYVVTSGSTPTPAPTSNPTPTASPTPTPAPTSTPTPVPTATPIPTVQLTMGLSGQGTISPATGTYTYNQGSQVTISATPASGYTFSYWLLGDDSEIFSASTTLTLTASQSAEAVFTSNTSPSQTPIGATPTPEVTPIPIPSTSPTATSTPTTSALSPYVNVDELCTTLGGAIIFISALCFVFNNKKF